MKNLKDEGIICPWCPSEKGVPVLIHNCGHNPFKLMKRVLELEDEDFKNRKAASILNELKEYMEVAK